MLYNLKATMDWNEKVTTRTQNLYIRFNWMLCQQALKILIQEIKCNLNTYSNSRTNEVFCECFIVSYGPFFIIVTNILQLINCWWCDSFLTAFKILHDTFTKWHSKFDVLNFSSQISLSVICYETENWIYWSLLPVIMSREKFLLSEIRFSYQSK